ncbi:MAG: glycine--tRNA ligase subunit beta [Gammaproteobacteria bacterium 28-57-27]|nr:MAG: glycine--tRNA ligase subunit beta [Gammaproteobacteria bacterium 28-57-27]
MNTRDLLIEIGTEELPPKALTTLANALADGITRRLHEAGLEPQGHTVYAAPRRLAVWVQGVREHQPEREVERRGPAVNAAFDSEGKPSKALEGFARSCGVTVNELEELLTDKGAWMVYRAKQPGQAAQALIPDMVAQALDALPIPKRMRWGAGETAFVRPLHWIVLLFGADVIEAEIYGIQTGRTTRGHRFHHPEPLIVPAADEYAALLESTGHVIADFATRRAMIKAQVESAAAGLGGHPVLDDDLLDEVAALTEWPRVITGNFEPRFLDVPKEALISTMQGNQRYFPLLDAAGNLLPHFITVANIDSRDPAAVQLGNERVIRPRFSDAEFFWKEDRKQPLSAHLESLKTVVFQQKLGTLFDKTERVMRLARHIAALSGADLEHAARAALLAKCDLMSGMVGEFPELQGIMGRYLAKHDGEAAVVAQALDEAYMPRRAGDELPASSVGQALALAERIDTLVGIFAVASMEPTGSKDPFALRRAALGVLRILIEKNLDLDMRVLLQFAYAADFPGVRANHSSDVDKLFDFMLERMRAYAQDRGIRHDVFDAVLATRPTRPLDFEQRMQAVNDFLALPQAEALAAANKRIGNILKKVEGELPSVINDALLLEPAERELANRVQQLEAELAPLFAAGDYTAALGKLAHLREVVDAFFDGVMVMADDVLLRDNRLALLNRMRALFLRVADISLLGGTA